MTFLFRAARRRRAGSATPSLSAQVEAILAGTTGFALDPTDLTTLWTTSTKAAFVSLPADPVGAYRTKWGSAQFDLLQATAGNRPAWPGTGSGSILGDGLAGRITAVNVNTFQNAPYALLCFKFRAVSLPLAQNAILSFSYFTASNPRIYANVTNTGVFRLTHTRRLDADVGHTDSSAAGLISAGVDYVATVQIDYAGTGNVSLRLNKAEVVSGNFPSILPGTPGNTENTASGNFDLLENDSTNFGNFRIGRGVFYPLLPGAGIVDVFEAWVDEGGALA